jgi:hypothetical protein
LVCEIQNTGKFKNLFSVNYEFVAPGQQPQIVSAVKGLNTQPNQKSKMSKVLSYL